MTAHRPRTTPSCGYDGTFTSFQSTGTPIFGYDASANWFEVLNPKASAGKTSNSRQFTGKERDSESGLDYFGARYYGSALGRFSSPDPIGIMKQKLLDPQQWNMYGYVRNNPLALTDPTGMYTNTCGQDDKKCNKAVAKLETQRQKDLKSKSDNVRAGAAAYGNPGQDNGVHIKFENKQWFLDKGEPTAGAETDPYKSGHGKTNIDVTFLYGQASGAHIAHEGTHVLNDQTFLNSWDPTTKTYDVNTNFVSFYTEEKAYLATFDRYGPNDVGKVDAFLLSSPTYKDKLFEPVFPNSSQFPQVDRPDD